jgi:hypothetical protein
MADETYTFDEMDFALDTVNYNEGSFTFDDLKYYCRMYAEIVEEKYWELNSGSTIIHPTERNHQQMLEYLVEQIRLGYR